jgi:hypothetical protein
VERIFDAVYGYIELEDFEFDLVNSPVFQRLHWIKQLGPLHTIFPSAQHSRFSHSIGVFHIITKMIDAIENRSPEYQHPFGKNDKKYLRYAALLHDIGHVPLSHIGEEVLKDSFSSGIDSKNISIETGSRWTSLFDNQFWGPATKLHELLSVEMVLHNEEIEKVLKKEWPDAPDLGDAKKRIAELIAGVGKDDTLSLLLHSELDADRLDYLLRDSFFTGVDYGKVDLEYVMSRLAVVKDEETNLHSLCFELKGLHTVEHCILGRFFLQTQVIYNKKVHLLDLLFLDVMKYMIQNGCGEKWGLMDLPEYIKHIRQSKGNGKHEHEHKIYEYTDAQVFMKMRTLHEELDSKLKEISLANSLKDKEAYINDCTKTIMDGQISDDILSHQIILDVSVDTEKINEIREEANRIAHETAIKLDVDPCRVKWDIIQQPVMKYLSNDDTNREAVKITYVRDSKPITEYVAKSNASLLTGLVDKTLLVFFVYYIRSKKPGEDIPHKEDVIKEAYQDFVLKYFQPNNQPCGCENGEHLCQVIRKENGINEAKRRASNPKFICRKCGGMACDKEHLCDGILI